MCSPACLNCTFTTFLHHSFGLSYFFFFFLQNAKRGANANANANANAKKTLFLFLKFFLLRTFIPFCSTTGSWRVIRLHYFITHPLFSLQLACDGFQGKKVKCESLVHRGSFGTRQVPSRRILQCVCLCVCVFPFFGV